MALPLLNFESTHAWVSPQTLCLAFCKQDSCLGVATVLGLFGRSSAAHLALSLFALLPHPSIRRKRAVRHGQVFVVVLANLSKCHLAYPLRNSFPWHSNTYYSSTPNKLQTASFTSNIEAAATSPRSHVLYKPTFVYPHHGTARRHRRAKF
jgi:hypothetical protein